MQVKILQGSPAQAPHLISAVLIILIAENLISKAQELHTVSKISHFYN